MYELKHTVYCSAMESFNAYQVWSKETAVYPIENEKEKYAYLALGLVGEAGEAAEKIKKFLRGDDGEIFSDERREDMKKELGDVLWYIARLSDELNIKLSDIAQLNHDKLTSRKKRGQIKGNGDNR